MKFSVVRQNNIDFSGINNWSTKPLGNTTKNIQKNTNEILTSGKTLEELFYGEKKKAKLDIFGKESRLGFENYKDKIGIDFGGEGYFFDKILHSALINKEDILERQKYIEGLLQNDKLENLTNLYNSSKNNIGNGFSYLGEKNEEEYGSNKDKKLIDILFEEKSIDEILALIDSEGYDSVIITYLKSFKIFISDFIKLTKELPQDNELLKNQKIIFNNFIKDLKFDRNFRDILTDLRDDKDYFNKIVYNTENFSNKYFKFGGVIKAIEFIKKSKLQKISFDEKKKAYYKDSFSIYETKEKNIKSDSIDNNNLNIITGPNGIGKTFGIEKDIYTKILAQSFGYSTVSEGNFEIYDKFISLNRLQSQSEKDENLSALGMEGKKLDLVYDEIENSTGNILLTLDETGSTTDEKNQFIIVRDFIEAVQKLGNKNRKIEIRLSTHNHLIGEYFKNKENIKVGFYTFSDDRKLEKGQRDSDTLNSFKRLLTRIENIDFNGYIENENELNLYGIYDEESKQDFISRANDIILKIEKFLDGEITEYKLPKEEIKSNRQLEYSDEEIEEMNKEKKGFYGTLINDYSWFYGEYNIDFKKGFFSKIGEIPSKYTYKNIFFSNTSKGNYIDIYNKDYLSSLEHIFSDKTNNIPFYNYFPLKIFFRLLNQNSINNVSIIYERQRLIKNLIKNNNIGEKLISDANKFLQSIQIIPFLFFKREVHTELDQYGIVKEKLYINYNEKKGIYKNLLLSLMYETTNNNDISGNFNCNYHTSILSCLKIGINNDIFSIEHFRENGPLMGLKQLIDFLSIFNLKISDFLDEDLLNFYNKIFDNLDLNEDKKIEFDNENKDNFKKLYKKIIFILNEGIDEKLKEKNIIINDFLDGKYNFDKIDNEFINKKWLDLFYKDYADKSMLWFYYKIQQIKNFVELYNSNFDIGQIEKNLKNLDSVLGKQLYNYFKNLFQFILGADLELTYQGQKKIIKGVRNPKDLILYLEKFNKLKEILNIKLGNIKLENGQQLKGLFNINGLQDEFLPSILGIELLKLLGLKFYADYIEKFNLSEVKHVNYPVLDIKNMKSTNVLDENYVSNDVNLNSENPILIINGANSSGKTEYINEVLKHIKEAFNYGFVNADSMTIGTEKVGFIDRVVKGTNNFSSGEQDIMFWNKTLKEIEDKDLVIINVDEIFSTMDQKYSTAFAYTFIGKLLEKGKMAIVISHNHEFVEKISKLNGVRVKQFDSRLKEDGTVEHTYKLKDGINKDSMGVSVLKSIGIGKKWLS